MVCIWPGFAMEMTPPQLHIHFEVLLSAGKLPTITVGDPGAQGAAMTGVQGAGVNSTGGGRLVAGLATLLHIPKGGILAIGLLSIMVAIGLEETIAVVCELTMRVPGAVPKEHIIFALIHTHIPKSFASVSFYFSGAGPMKRFLGPGSKSPPPCCPR